MVAAFGRVDQVSVGCRVADSSALKSFALVPERTRKPEFENGSFILDMVDFAHGSQGCYLNPGPGVLDRIARQVSWRCHEARTLPHGDEKSCFAGITHRLAAAFPE